MRAEAAEEISRVLRSGYGNPSSIHRRGHRSKILLESSRESVACLIGARPEEIVFTSGGTESNNLAVLGAALRAGSGHLVVSAIEHSSVLEASRHLETIGFRVSRVPPGSGGVVDPGALLDAVRPETVLISLIHSSNEIGTLQPVTEVCRRLGRPEVLVHSDAVQSAGKTPLDVATLGADLVSFSAHKLGGPPGVGALWIRGGIRLAPLFHGGGQESHRRAGTETLPLIAGFAVAARLAAQEISGESLRLGALRDALEAALARRIPGVRFHGRGAPRLPNTLSVAVEGCSGEALAIALDLEGIAVSTGSACAVGTVRPSHVLLALGCSEQVARSTLRISLGRATSPAEVERFAEVLEAVVGRMRAPAECLSAAADLRRRA